MKKILILIFIVNLLILNSCEKIKKYNFFGKKKDKTTQQLVQSSNDTIKNDTLVNYNTYESENKLPDANQLINDGKGIYMITGAFLIPSNAENYAASLREKGYNAFIIRGHGGFNMVAVEKYPDLKSALQDLSKFRSEIHPDAWVHVKKY